jgi:hypothetical protein
VSLKLLAKLIENIGSQLTMLKPETLQYLMKALAYLIDGKRPNTKQWTNQICFYIYNLIGNENYYNLMTYVLTKE